MLGQIFEPVEGLINQLAIKARLGELDAQSLLIGLLLLVIKHIVLKQIDQHIQLVFFHGLGRGLSNVGDELIGQTLVAVRRIGDMPFHFQSGKNIRHFIGGQTTLLN